MRRTLYWKRLLIVAAVAVLTGGAVFAVHFIQVRSQSSIYKQRAESAAATAASDPAKLAEAIDLYKRYLKFNARDEAAFKKYAELQLDAAKADPAPAAVERAAAGVEDFLRSFPNHPDERLKLAELYLASRQYQKLPLVKQHLQMLLDRPDRRDNVEVLEMMAECEYAQNSSDPGPAIAHLQKAIKTGNAPVRVYVRLAGWYASKPSLRDNANSVLQELRTGRFETDPEACVAAARLTMVLNSGGPGVSLTSAQDDLNRVFGKPGGRANPDALLAQAELELAKADPNTPQAANAEAEKHLREAFRLDPKNVPVGTLLAEVLVRQGKRDEGIAVLKAAADAMPGANDKFMQLVDRLIDLGETEHSAALVQAGFATDPAKATITNYFRGRIAVVKGEWATATKLLDEVAPNLVRVPFYHKKAMLGLAACYAALQNPDKQLEYCEQALKDDGEYTLAVIGKAEALVKMGKNEQAVRLFRLIVNTKRVAAYRPELARLELVAALAQPAEARDWLPFDAAVEPADPKNPDVQIYRADADVARGHVPQAVERLRKWLADNPGGPAAPAVWVALARVTDGGKIDSAIRVLNEAEGKIGNTVEIRLARADLLTARAKPTSPAELEPLAADAAKFSQADQFRLQFGLGRAAARVADRPAEGEVAKKAQAEARGAALKYLRAAADLTPRELLCRAVLLDQALAAGREDLVTQAIKEMAGIEGENGPYAALATIAVRLPKLKERPDPKAELKELRALAERIRDLRPGWSRVHVALAQLDELDGLPDEALKNYEKAILNGERQESVVRRVVELYRRPGKQEDLKAIDLLDRLANEVRLPDDLERQRSIHHTLTAKTPEEAKQTIDRIAPYDSPKFETLQLRGALLAAVRDDAGALKAFERAVEKNDKVPETWSSLVEQLVRQGAVERARAAVKEAEPKLQAPKEAPAAQKAERLLAIGGLYEAVGDAKKALENYAAAREAAPAELNPVRQLVTFYQRTGNAQADALLAAAKDAPTPSIARWARRHLALTIVARDGYARRGDALALIERNLSESAKKEDEDLKAQAMVWTADPATREAGVTRLREYAARSDLTPDEFDLLGQLAFDQGKFAEAAQHFARAARVRPGTQPRHMVGAVRAHLALAQNMPPGNDRSGMIGLAEDAAERLKTQFPASWEATRERARVLHARSRDRLALTEFDEAKRLTEEAVKAIKAYPNWDAPDAIAARTGPLFEELGLTDEAEKAYRKFLAADLPAVPNARPAAHVPLAILYIRQRQPEKAIKLAREYEKKAPTLTTARLLSGATRANPVDPRTKKVAPPDPATVAEINRFLDAALAAAAGNAALEAALIGSKAEVLDAQGRYDEAIAEYRRALAKAGSDPKDRSDLVVNNLCMLLALHDSPEKAKNADEAVRLMSELIAVRGPVPAYLDTRAVAYLVSSRPAEAAKDLQHALVQLERPTYQFHLGWALDLDAVKERNVFARDKLRMAQQLGLTAADLHPIEFRKYVELLTKHNLPTDDVK